MVVPGAPKSSPLLNFDNFSRTIERYDIKVSHTSYPIHLFANLESFITLSTEWQNCAVFRHGNLAVNCDVIKS